MANNNRLIRDAATRANILDLAITETIIDPDLTGVTPEFIEQSRAWLNLMTDPIKAFAAIDLYAEQLILSTGAAVSKTNKRIVKQAILWLFHEDVSFNHAYEGAIIVTTTARGIVKLDCKSSFSVAVREIPRIVQRLVTRVPAIFGGQQQNIENFNRVLLATFRHYRALYISALQQYAERDNQRLETQKQKAKVAEVLKDNGVNPSFGSLAIVDRKFLSVIAPGPGTQQDKIRAARNDPHLKIGSCSAELNFPEQGLRAFLMGSLNSKLSHDQEFIQSTEPAAKRQRMQAVADTILHALEPLVDVAHDGMTNAQIHRKVYNPLAGANLLALQN